MQDPPASRPAAPEAAASRRARAPASRPTPAPADVATPAALEAALYDVISGPAGKARDWTRFRSLFFPGARMVTMGANGPESFTPEDYVRRAGPVLEGRGFFERGIRRHEERFGGVAHVFSTYEARMRAEDATPFARGVNSVQMVRDREGWAVTSITWDVESPERPLPPTLLPPK